MRFSILSARASSQDNQPRVAGKIRPGIKVLTLKAEQDPRAVEIYEEGVRNRLKFTEIEKQIERATGLDRSMYPRNTAYFNVSASDFGMPELAERIINLYGVMRKGDEVPHLYRFPVVFHSDELHEVYPNQFKRHGAEPHYESHYGEDGERYCRYLPEVSQAVMAERRAARITRMPRREKVIRGLCDPHSCSEYQSGECKFRGKLLFYVPGVPTTGLLVMETSSEYAAEGIWADLERIRQTLGTIPRSNPTHPGKPIFWITKVQEQRTYYDKNGKRQVGLQWVPRLQADIDIGKLLTIGQKPVEAAAPVAWLEQRAADPVGLALPPALAPASVSASDQFALLVAKLGLDEGLVMDYFDIKIAQSWENEPSNFKVAVNMLTDLLRVGEACAGKLISIAVKLHRLNIGQSDFQAYAFGKHGKGYTGNEEKLSSLERELDEYAQIPVDRRKPWPWTDAKYI
jgi:hypothetical protein